MPIRLNSKFAGMSPPSISANPAKFPTQGGLGQASNEQRPRKSLRLMAFASVAFATVSVLGCVITLPIVYSHVQSIQAFMQNEVDFCKAFSMDPSN